MTPRRVILAILATALFLTYVPIGDYDDEAIVITRNPEGEWDYEGDAAFAFELRVSTASTSTRENTTSMTSPDAGAWRCERVWILNTSDSDITRAVGVALQQDLLKEPALHEVAYFGHDELALEVRRPPDLYILLELEESSSFIVPGFGRFGSSVNVTAGRRPSLATSSLDGSDVPFSVLSGIDCLSQTVGIVTPGARNAELASGIVGTLDFGARFTWADESLPRHPSPSLDWIEDAATPPTDLPTFGDGTTPLHLYSQGAWLRHEETLWQVQVPGDPNAWMADYLESLRGEGWSAHDPRHASNQDSPRATASLGSRHITISASTRPGSKSRSAASPGASRSSNSLRDEGPDLPDPVGPTSDHATTFLISHETRFTGHEIRRLFELNPEAWFEMIPHLSAGERNLLIDELAGDTNPAMQDLAAQLAQD